MNDYDDDYDDYDDEYEDDIPEESYKKKPEEKKVYAEPRYLPYVVDEILQLLPETMIEDRKEFQDFLETLKYKSPEQCFHDGDWHRFTDIFNDLTEKYHKRPIENWLVKVISVFCIIDEGEAFNRIMHHLDYLEQIEKLNNN